MKRLFFLLLLISETINAQGLLTKMGINAANKSFAISYYSYGEREVATVPMLHVNTSGFYQMTKSKIDSLRNEGYQVFYEGIDSAVTDSLEIDVLNRKFRQITGFALMDYMDEDNEAFKSLQKKKFVSQADVNYGVNPDTDYRADLDMEEMIAKFEKRYGEIVLTDCDLKTPLGKKYKCAKVDEKKEYYILNGIRDRHVLNEIEKSDAQKIVLVYGRIHIMDFHSKIQKEGWRHIREKTERITKF